MNTTNTHLDTQRGASIYVPGLDRFVTRSDATERALERLVRSRGASSTVVTAAVVLAHLRGAETPSDAAMTLVDALITDSAHRATVIAAVRSLGAERGFPLLRRALRMRADEESVREIATAMLEVAFRRPPPLARRPHPGAAPRALGPRAAPHAVVVRHRVARRAPRGRDARGRERVGRRGRVALSRPSPAKRRGCPLVAGMPSPQPSPTRGGRRVPERRIAPSWWRSARLGHTTNTPINTPLERRSNAAR
ncbi:MAG: hypothetical protein U0326_09080 [Polyangiales bacterium]